MMGAEETRGAHSPIFTAASGKTDPMMMLAVMVILVIFIFVIFAIFAMRRDKRDGGGIAEVAAAGLLAKQGGLGGGYEGGYAAHVAHDNCRDNLKEFGELKKEVALTKADTDAKAAQYFYQTQKAIDDSKFEAYKIAVEQAEKTRQEIAQIETLRRQDELAREREGNLAHKIIGALRHPGYGARAFSIDDYGNGLGAIAG